MVKSFAIAASLALATTAGAEAACSTSSLAGLWDVGSGLGECSVRIYSTGAVKGDCGGIPVTGKLRLASDCKLSGELMGERAVGRTEAIDAGSALKPNLLLGSTAQRLGAFAAYRR